MSPTDPEMDDPADALEAAEDHAETPLVALREEVAASAAEARRNARRTLDVLKQFGGVLDALSVTLDSVHRSVRDRAPSAPASLSEDRAFLLRLVELADRIDRIENALERRPAGSSWWPGARELLQEWREDRERIADAFSILGTHLDGMLHQAGLQRMQVANKPFDPASMTAVEATEDTAVPDHTVLEEIVPGWTRPSGEVVRPAQVRVSRRAGT